MAAKNTTPGVSSASEDEVSYSETETETESDSDSSEISTDNEDTSFMSVILLIKIGHK